MFTIINILVRLTVPTCGFDRRSQAAATRDQKSRSPDPWFEYQLIRASYGGRRYVSCVFVFTIPVSTRRLPVVPSIMLDMQYRMHPEISRFPSSEFYAKSLKDGTVDSGGNVLARLQPPVSEHLVINAATGGRPSVVFLDHDGLEATKDRSKINVTDAAIVCAVLEDLLRQNEVEFSFLPSESCAF